MEALITFKAGLCEYDVSVCHTALIELLDIENKLHQGLTSQRQASHLTGSCQSQPPDTSISTKKMNSPTSVGGIALFL